MRTLAIFTLCVVGCTSLNVLQAGNLTPPPMPRAQAEMYARRRGRQAGADPQRLSARNRHPFRLSRPNPHFSHCFPESGKMGRKGDSRPDFLIWRKNGG